MMMEVKLPVKLGFEADILFSTKGASFGSSDYKLSYIDIPVVMKIYMVKVLRLLLDRYKWLYYNCTNIDIESDW